MNRNYVMEYGEMLKRAIKGVQLRALFFGMHSSVVEKYIDRNKLLIQGFEIEALEKGERVYTRKNLNLASRLFGLEVKCELAQAFA